MKLFDVESLFPLNHDLDGFVFLGEKHRKTQNITPTQYEYDIWRIRADGLPSRLLSYDVINREEKFWFLR